MLKNARVTAFTVSELFLENQHVGEEGGVGVILPLLHTQINSVNYA